MIAALLLFPLIGFLAAVVVYMSTMTAFLVVIFSALSIYMSILMAFITAFMVIMFA